MSRGDLDLVTERMNVSTTVAPGIWRPMELLLWILAVVLVVAGVLALFRRQVLWGIVLIIVGLLVGPGGVSLFS